MEINTLPKEQHCTQCSEQKAVALTFCETCTEYLCEDCTNAHKRTKVTKAHRLQGMHPELSPHLCHTDNGLGSLQTFCPEEKHANLELGYYCLDCGLVMCDLCATEGHKGHRSMGIDEAYKEISHAVTQLCSNLRKIKFVELETNMNKNIEDAKQNSREVEIKLNTDLKRFHKIVDERQYNLQEHIKASTERFIKNGEEVKQKIRETANDTERTISEAERLGESSKILFLKSYSDISGRLQHLINRVPVPEVFRLQYSRGLTDEEFANAMSVACTVQDFSNVRGNEDGPPSNDQQIMDVLKSFALSDSLEPPPLSSSIYSDTAECAQLGTTEAVVKVTLSPTSMVKLQAIPLPTCLQMNIPNDGKAEMTHSSNKTAHLRSACVMDSFPVNTVKDGKSQTNKSVDDSELVSHFNECFEEAGFARGKMMLLKSEEVKRMVAMRFETWGLACTWRVHGERIVLQGTSKEDCEKAIEILKDVVQEDFVVLSKAAALTVNADTWQEMTQKLRRNYHNQINIEVLLDENKVFVYATCRSILRDACDTIRLYVRSHQIKTITMRYDEAVIRYVLRHKKTLQKLQNKLSNFHVLIAARDATSISVTGSGEGLGEAVKIVHIIASKLGKETDEDRFDSADEDEEDEPRFSDDDEASNDSFAALRVRLALSTGECEYDLRAIVFLEGGRLLYVVAGDISQLPVEGLVNPANEKMKHDGGLAKVLVQKGGRIIQEECTFHVLSKGVVPEGQIFCSSAGNLSCAVIIHAVGPRWKDGTHGEEQRLAEVVNNCLRSSSRNKLSSLALPAISAGSFKFPLDKATEIIVKQISDFVKEFPNCSVREIYLCDFAMEPVNAFTSAIRRYFDVRTCITQWGNDLNGVAMANRPPDHTVRDARTVLFQNLYQ